MHLFEGIFDFLAYLAHTKRKELPVTAVILNSVAMRSRFEDWLCKNSHVQRINCYCDNDDSGRLCFSQLRDRFSQRQFQDYSTQYPEHKDFADWFAAL